MPTHKTKFNKQWQASTDENGDKIEKWCIPGDTLYTFRCMFCKTNKDMSCANQGKQQLLQHAKGENQKINQIIKGDKESLHWFVDQRIRKGMEIEQKT